MKGITFFSIFIFLIALAFLAPRFLNTGVNLKLENFSFDRQKAASSKQEIPVAPTSTPTSSATAEEEITLRYLGDIKKDLIESNNDFMEINFPQMKLRLYKEGKVIREYPVLARGNEPIWGGTPAGYYQVGNKIREAFAFVEGLYMPWALQIYGKFWIHGVPYFPGGRKVYSRYSHGCVRLEDKNAKLLFGQVEPGLPIVVIDRERDNFDYLAQDRNDNASSTWIEAASSTLSQSSKIELPQISASGFLVADLENDFVLASRNGATAQPMGGLTQLMSASVVSENVDLRRSIALTQDMISRGNGTTTGLVAEKRYHVIELLFPVMIEGSSVASEILSDFMGRDRTIQTMNQKAQSIDMMSTSFVDPSGQDIGNTSTPEDIYYLMRYVNYNLSPLLKMSRSIKPETFGSIALGPKNFENKNIFWEEKYFLGGMATDSVDQKKNGAFIFKFKNPDQKTRALVFIVLNSSDLAMDVENLSDYLNKKYGLVLAK